MVCKCINNISEVNDDILWLANHPLWGNVVGIMTSRDTDTPEGLESWLSVRIRRIPTELPRTTELELGKLRQIQMDSDRASALELLWGFLTSREVLWPSEPCLSLLYKEWTWEHYRKPNLTFFKLSAGRSTGVFIGGLKDQRRRPEGGGWMGANQKSSTELGLSPKIDPTRLSSISVKTT
jgi:hypothetical protein